MSWFDSKDKDPSTKDANKDFDDENLDSALDLDMGGDFGYEDNPEVSKKNRNPISQGLHNIGLDLDNVSTNAYDGASSGIREQLDKSMPSVSSLYEGGKDLISEMDTLRSESIDKIVPAYNATMRSARKLATSLEGRLPFHLDKKIVSLIDKIHNPDEGGYEEKSKDQMRDESQSNALASIFGAEQEQRIEDKKQAVLEKTFDRRIGQIHHRETAGILSIIRNQATYQTAFIRGTFTAYLKKDLELKYKQLYATEDTLESFKLTAKMLQERLDAIVKNTALPEADKITTSELISKKIKEGLLGTMGGKLTGYFGKMAGNIKENYIEPFLDKLGMGQQMMDMMSDALEMQNDFEGKPQEFDWWSIPRMLTGWGIKKASKQFGKRLIERVSGGLDERTRLMIENATQMGGNTLPFVLHYMSRGGLLKNLPPDLQRTIGTMTEGILDKQNTVTNNVDYDTLDQGGKLTNRTTLTIEQIIPSYLKTQTKYLEMLATGDKNATELEWDYKQGKLVAGVDYRQQLIRDISGGDGQMMYEKKVKVLDTQKLINSVFDNGNDALYQEINGELQKHADDITKVLTGIAVGDYDIDSEREELMQDVLDDLWDIRSSIEAGKNDFQENDLFQAAFTSIAAENVLPVVKWFIRVLEKPKGPDDDNSTPYEHVLNTKTADLMWIQIWKYRSEANSRLEEVILGEIRNGNASQLEKMGIIHRNAYGSWDIERNQALRLVERNYGGSRDIKDLRATKEDLASEGARLKELQKSNDREKTLKKQEKLDRDLETAYYENNNVKTVIDNYLEKHPGKTLIDAIKDPKFRPKLVAMYRNPLFNWVIALTDGSFDKLKSLANKANDKIINLGGQSLLRILSSIDDSLGDISVFLEDKENGVMRDKKNIRDVDILKWLASVKNKKKLLEKFDDNVSFIGFLNQLPNTARKWLRYFQAHPDELDSIKVSEAYAKELNAKASGNDQAAADAVHADFEAGASQESIDLIRKAQSSLDTSIDSKPKNTNAQESSSDGVTFSPNTAEPNSSAGGTINARITTYDNRKLVSNLVRLAQTRNRTLLDIQSGISRLVDTVAHKKSATDKNNRARQESAFDSANVQSIVSNILKENNRTFVDTFSKQLEKYYNTTNINESRSSAVNTTVNNHSDSKYGGRVTGLLETISKNVSVIKDSVKDRKVIIDKISLDDVLPEKFKTIFIDPVVAAVKATALGLSEAVKLGMSAVYTAATGKELLDKNGEKLSWLGSKLGGAGHSALKIGGDIIGSVRDYIKEIKPIEKLKNLATTVTSKVTGGVSQTYSGLSRAYDDVYSSRQKDKSKPLVSGEAFRDGLVVDVKGNKVPTVYDIKGPCYLWDKDKEAVGNMVISTEDIAEGDGLIFADGTPIKSTFLSRFAAKARRAGTIISNITFNIPGKIAAAGKFLKEHSRFLWEKKDPFIDIYIIDKNTKDFKRVIAGKDLENNKSTRKYVYKKNGKWVPLTSAYLIEHEIYENTDSGYKVIIDSDDLEAGVYDVDGNRLTRFRGASVIGKVGVASMKVLGAISRSAIKLAKGAGRLLKTAAGKAVDLFSGGLKLLGEGGTAVGNFITSAFTSVVTAFTGIGISRKDLSEIVGDRLLDIYGLLYERLPAGKVNGDNDGNGLRDGSYYDYKKRREEHKKEVKERREANKKKQEEDKKKMAEDGEPNGAAGAAAEAADENNSDGDSEGGGFWSTIGAMFGAQALGGVVSDKLSGAAGSVKEGIRNRANNVRERVKNSKAARRAKAKARLARMRLRHAAGRGVLGAARTVGGLGMKGLGLAGSAAGSILGLGGKALLGTAGMALKLGGGLLGLTGKIAAGILGGPIGWALTLGTIGYQVYNWATDSAATKLLRIPRAKAYGLTVKNWEAFEDLETDTYEAWKNQQEGVDDKRLEQFGEKIDFIGGAEAGGLYDTEGDSDEENKTEYLKKWYKARFLPAYRDYVTVLCQVTKNDGSKQPKADDVDQNNIEAVKTFLDRKLAKYATGVLKDLAPNKKCFAKWLREKLTHKDFQDKERHRKENKEFGNKASKYLGRSGKTFSYAWNEIKHGNVLNGLWAGLKGITQALTGAAKFVIDTAGDLANTDENAYDHAWREAKLVAYNFKKRESGVKQTDALTKTATGAAIGAAALIPHAAAPLAATLLAAHAVRGMFAAEDDLDRVTSLEDKAMPIIDQARPDLDRDELKELADDLISTKDMQKHIKDFGGDLTEALDARVDYVATWWGKIFMPIFKSYLKAMRAITKTNVGDKPHINDVPGDLRSQTIEQFKSGAAKYKKKFKLFDLIPTVDGYAKWFMAIDKSAIDRATTYKRTKSLSEKLTDDFRGVGHEFGDSWKKLWDGDVKGSAVSFGRGLRKFAKGAAKAISDMADSLSHLLTGWFDGGSTEKVMWEEVRFKFYHIPDVLGTGEKQKARRLAIENLENEGLKQIEEGKHLSEYAITEFGVAMGLLRPTKRSMDAALTKANNTAMRTNMGIIGGGTGALLAEIRNQENRQKEYDEKHGGNKEAADKRNEYAKKYLNFWIEKVFIPIFSQYVSTINMYTGRVAHDGLLNLIGLNKLNPDDIREEHREDAMKTFKELASKISKKYSKYELSDKGLDLFIKESEEYAKQLAAGNLKVATPNGTAAAAAIATENKQTKEILKSKINPLADSDEKDTDKGVINAVYKAADQLSQDLIVLNNAPDSDTLAAYLGVNDKDKKVPEKWRSIILGGTSITKKFMLARLKAYSNLLGNIPNAYLNANFQDKENGIWLTNFCNAFGLKPGDGFNNKNLEESLLEYQIKHTSNSLEDNISKIAVMLFFTTGNPYALEIYDLLEHTNDHLAYLNPAIYNVRRPGDYTISFLSSRLDHAAHHNSFGQRVEKMDKGQERLLELKDILETWYNIVKEWVAYVVNPIFSFYTTCVNSIADESTNKLPDPEKIPEAKRLGALTIFLTRSEKMSAKATRTYLRDFNLGAGSFAVPVDKIIEEYNKFHAKEDKVNNRASKGHAAYSKKGTVGYKPEEAEETKNTSKEAEGGAGGSKPKKNGSKYDEDPKDMSTSVKALSYFGRLYANEETRKQLSPDIIEAYKKEMDKIFEYAKAHDLPISDAMNSWFVYKKEKGIEDTEKSDTSDHKKMANGGVFSVGRGGVVDAETNLDNITIGEAGTETVLPHKGGGRFNKLVTNAIRSVYGSKTAGVVNEILNGRKATRALLRKGLDKYGLGDVELTPTELILLNLYKRFFPKPLDEENDNAEEENAEGGATYNPSHADLVLGRAAGTRRSGNGATKGNFTDTVVHTYERVTGREDPNETYRKYAATAKAIVNDADRRKLAAKIWKYFTARGWSEAAVAGLLGNLQQESGIECVRVQGDLQPNRQESLRYTKEKDANRQAFIDSQRGYGLAQWTYWSRKQALWDFAHSKGKSIGDTDVQIEYLCKEFDDGLMTYPLGKLKSCQSPTDAAIIILLNFERPDPSRRQIEIQHRTQNAVVWYETFGKGKVNKVNTEEVLAQNKETDKSNAENEGAAGKESAGKLSSIGTGSSGVQSVAGAALDLTSGGAAGSYSGHSSGNAVLDAHGQGILKPENLHISSDEIPKDGLDALAKLRGLRTMKGANTSYGGGNWKSVAHLNPELIKRLYLAGKLYENAKGKNAKQWTITSAFRSYNDQAAIKRRYPHDAARPGTSRHETGIAVDLGDANFGGIKNKAYDRGTVVDELEPYLKALGVIRKYRPGKLNEAQHFELQPGKLPDISALMSESGAEKTVAEGKKEVKELPKTDPDAIKEAEQAKDKTDNKKDTSADEVVQAKQTDTASSNGSVSGVTQLKDQKPASVASAALGITSGGFSSTTELAADSNTSADEVVQAKQTDTASSNGSVSGVMRPQNKEYTAEDQQNIEQAVSALEAIVDELQLFRPYPQIKGEDCSVKIKSLSDKLNPIYGARKPAEYKQNLKYSNKALKTLDLCIKVLEKYPNHPSTKNVLDTAKDTKELLAKWPQYIQEELDASLAFEKAGAVTPEERTKIVLALNGGADSNAAATSQAKDKTNGHKKMANGGIFALQRGGVVDAETNLDNITIGEAGAETVLPHKGGGRFNKLVTNAIRSVYGSKIARVIGSILGRNGTTSGIVYPDSYRNETRKLLADRSAASTADTEAIVTTEQASRQLESATTNAPKITTNSVANGVSEINNGSANTLAALNYQSTILEAIKNSVTDICKSIKPTETKSGNETVSQPTVHNKTENLADVIVNAMKEGFAAMSEQLSQLLQNNNNAPAAQTSKNTETRRTITTSFPLTTAKRI